MMASRPGIRRQTMTRWLNPSVLRKLLPTTLSAGCLGIAIVAVAGGFDPNLQEFPDPTGAVLTVSTTGSVDTTNPFFQSLGTNGRACVSCHQAGDAWTVTPPH